MLSGQPRLWLFVALLLAWQVQAGTVYKCIKEDKVVFSQQPCPQAFTQHRIEYQYGVTTETAEGERVDPLQSLLENDSLPEDKLLRRLEAEVYRLQQENSYLEILRTSELQKQERQRYWQKMAREDPAFIEQRGKINAHFDELKRANDDKIAKLQQYRQLLQQKTEAQP
ncbi:MULTISPECIES: DUF4124 domain-containing protein [Shewanella]|jgi:hypothetical protein|uniref:DUF4124 domain-containing protein n=1 Tax=Shewanella indica TaxID=768528 RepID=A0ABU4Q6X7_9GAMM|nr:MULTISPECIES: DUF4124 domain-containing protein [Shewanella]OIN16744.1 hypothetical protein BFS86_07490 [Shewanella algae]BCV37787.1 hypothetical protein TUM17377_31150 [Shewanella chilikensis]MCE9792101.1 DUF4124 domain-containing protein [Shewanella indica]MDX6015192.1 DUF4124 domain-containing protein [Shewanella indica]NDO74866.1 DUF4124 domain-containing protein [Shewanella sp. SE1]